MTARTYALAALACLTLSLVVTQAQAQTFPSKPVRIVVAVSGGRLGRQHLARGDAAA